MKQLLSFLAILIITPFLLANQIATGLYNPRHLCMSQNNQYLFFSENGLNIKKIDLTDPNYPITTLLSENDIMSEFGFTSIYDYAIISMYSGPNDFNNGLMFQIMHNIGTISSFENTDIFELPNPETYTYSLGNVVGIMGSPTPRIYELPASIWYDEPNVGEDSIAALGIDINADNMVVDAYSLTNFNYYTVLQYHLNASNLGNYTHTSYYYVTHQRNQNTGELAQIYGTNDPNVAYIDNSGFALNGSVYNEIEYCFYPNYLSVIGASVMYSIIQTSSTAATNNTKIVEITPSGVNTDLVTNLTNALDLVSDQNNAKLYYSEAGIESTTQPNGAVAYNGSISFHVLSNMGVEDMLPSDNEVSIYPNPIKNTLHIQTNDTLLEVEILDSNGRVLHSFSSPSSQFDVSDLEKGVYFVRIQTDKQITTEKIIKE